MYIYRHKPCNEKMKISKQCEKISEYPQTHTCKKCGAYLFIDGNGIVTFYNALGQQVSDWKQEIDESELKGN